MEEKAKDATPISSFIVFSNIKKYKSSHFANKYSPPRETFGRSLRRAMKNKKEYITLETKEMLASKLKYIFSSHCTEVRFASFLFGGFISAIVVNPSERKLAKSTSVHSRRHGIFTKLS